MREVTLNFSDLEVEGDNVFGVVRVLFPGTRYVLTVVAVNGAMRANGVGMVSAPVTAFTESSKHIINCLFAVVRDACFFSDSIPAATCWCGKLQ